MKTNLRRGIFETNSSSTHSICVTKNNILDQKVDYLNISIGEFGWEMDNLNSPNAKASYIYTGILCLQKDELLTKFKKFFINNDIDVEFEEPEYNTYGDSKYLGNGHIDHYNELTDFIKICNDEDKLMKYLFSSQSFIITGNDNNDCDVNINVNYEYEEYYKGN